MFSPEQLDVKYRSQAAFNLSSDQLTDPFLLADGTMKAGQCCILGSLQVSQNLAEAPGIHWHNDTLYL